MYFHMIEEYCIFRNIEDHYLRILYPTLIKDTVLLRCQDFHLKYELI